jgi:aromatic-L-amino-acid decarboxylase
MNEQNGLERLRKRTAALELSPDEFRKIGHRLVDQLGDFLAELPARAVTPGEAPAEVRRAIAADRSLPEAGRDASAITAEAAELLLSHSLFNGHPRFFGYITSSATPIGALGDLMASALNCNAGAWKLAPAASEIEAQTIRWIAEFIGYREGCGGLLVSGGNMANFVGFLAARAAAGGMNLRKEGVRAAGLMRCYGSRETHTWIQKAADMAGLGTDSVRWIACDSRQRLDVAALRAEVARDRERGEQPFMVVGTAGTVSTGAVDPLTEIAEFCREQGLWFHVDGAYGGLAAGVPGAPEELAGLAPADSVAVDPHKWLYAPLEAGCILVRDPGLLLNAFSYRPPYYNFETDGINYFDFGPQNSRGFRALKIWLAFQQAGRRGFQESIADDMALAEHAFRMWSAHPDFEAVTCNLSICTFRYVPPAVRAMPESEEKAAMLNRLNQELLGEIERSGAAFLSNAVVEGKYLLRMCIVNFRTSLEDIEALSGLIAEIGERTFQRMEPAGAATL